VSPGPPEAGHGGAEPDLRALSTPDEPGAPALVIGKLKPVDTSEASSTLDKRKTIIGAIVTIVVLIIIFVGLIPKFGSYADAWAEIQGMTAAALALIGLSVLVMLAVYVLPYQAAIPGLPYKPAFVIRQTSFMISNTIPAGGAFGLAIQFAMLASYSVSVAAATAGIAVTSLWSLFMTLTLPVFGVIAALMTGQVQSQWVWVAVAGIAATVTSVVVLWLILRSEVSARKVGDLGNRLLAPVNRRRAQPLDAVGMSLDLRNSTSDVVLGRWRWVTVSNYLVVVAQFAVLWFAIQGVLGDQPTTLTLAGAFAAFAISRMASMIPVTPGGLGTVDAALIALLTTFGLTNEQAVAATLVWRACSWVPQVCLGILTFVYWRLAQARVTRAAQA
jgi:uncharacterized protein (TIRG00374 family)